ncbi:MAG: hypothetical protein U1F27_03220 [Turneriella sp.]
MNGKAAGSLPKDKPNIGPNGSTIIDDYSFEVSPEKMLVFVDGEPAYVLPPIDLKPSFDIPWKDLNYGNLYFWRRQIMLEPLPGGNSGLRAQRFMYKIENNRAWISRDAKSFSILKFRVTKKKGWVYYPSEDLKYLRIYQLQISCEFFDHIFEFALGGRNDKDGH